MKYKEYLIEGTEEKKVSQAAKEIGVDVWSVDKTTKIKISIDDEEISDDPKAQKNFVNKIAKIYKVHPSSVEYDSDFGITITIEEKITI